MAFCKKNIFHTIALIILVGLSGCGKIQGNPSHFSRFASPLASNNASNFPAPDSLPQLKYTPIESVFENSSDITTGENTLEIFTKLREISSLTKDYHLELLDIVKNADALDFTHLMIIADASYFPALTYQQMITMQADPRACETLSPLACNEKIEQIKKNKESAQNFGIFINQILLAGQSRVDQLTNEEAYTLLTKAYPALDSTNSLINEVARALPDLSSEEKLNFISLAVTKSAWTSALALTLDWFNSDSDKDFEALITGANRLPPLSQVRDDYFIQALETISHLTPSQAKQITLMALNQSRIAQASLYKVSEVSAHELAEIVSACNSPEVKDQLITLSISKIKSTTSEQAVELIRQSSKHKIQVAQTLISLIPNFAPMDLVLIALNSSYTDDREEIIKANIMRFNKVTASEIKAIADQSTKNKFNIIISLLPKAQGLTAIELAHIIESINTGTGRDQALLASLKYVQSSDVAGVVAILNIAYNSKLEATMALLAKTNPLTANDLAFIAKNSANAATRDQILIKGAAFLTETNVEGIIAMTNLSVAEKVNIIIATLAKLKDSSANDLGLILKSIADGPTRDKVIAGGLSILKKINGDGAALIVERSFDNKVATATKLITMMPEATGTDLKKILTVCGSGNTRDLILANTIKLLGKLTKDEAKTLYGRAYNNKDTVAILLMSKVDDIDGETIGEMALLSGKGVTRDLIITEGLKRIKKISIKGLISLIKAADKLAERLALEVSATIENFKVENAVDIANAISNIALRDRFLIRAIDLIKNLDEPMLTTLALEGSNRTVKEEIVRKGVEKIGDTL